MAVSNSHPWHVEAVQVECGGSLHGGYEVRHGDEVWSVTGVASLAGFLVDRGVDASQIAAPEAGLPSGEDGCE